MIRVELLVSGINVDDDVAVSAVEAAGGELVDDHGVTRLVVHTEEPDPQAVLDVVARVREDLPVTVIRVAPGIVSPPEISNILGISRQAARDLTKREDFPPLYDNLRGHIMWRLVDIAGWLAAEGYELPAQPPSDDFAAAIERGL